MLPRFRAVPKNHIVIDSPFSDPAIEDAHRSRSSSSGELHSLETASISPRTDHEDTSEETVDADDGSKYFGKGARGQFFALFRKMSRYQLKGGSLDAQHPSHEPVRRTKAESRSCILDANELDVDEPDLQSPRSHFIGRILSAPELLPLPILLRDKTTTLLDLSHRSLGNRFVCTLRALASASLLVASSTAMCSS
jgi:hypothetical protein